MIQLNSGFLSLGWAVGFQENDIRLDTDIAGNARSERPEMCSDGNGHIYVVWQDKRNGESDIYFNYSSNYGTRWQPTDIRLNAESPETHFATFPEVDSDDKGHVYVAWHDSRNGDGNIYFNYSSPRVKSLITQDTFRARETLYWDIVLDGPGKVDAYLVIVFPSGDFICLTDLNGGHRYLNTSFPIVSNWNIISGTFRIFSYPFTGEEYRGQYQLYVILTKPGSNPSEKNNWIASDSATLIF